MAGKESPAVADNGRTPRLQISGFMLLMEMLEKEDEEVSSQATTLQFGSPATSRYVSPVYPYCANFDCDLCEDPPETEVGHVQEDERNTAPHWFALYLQNKARAYHLRMKWKDEYHLRKGRSGGRAAPKKDRKAKGKEEGKEAEPCICDNCMWQETYDLYIKDKEKA